MRKLFVAAVVALALGCSSKPETPDAGGPGGGVGGGEGGGGGTVEQDAGPDSATRFCDDFGANWCGTLVRCGYLPSADLANCAAETSRNRCAAQLDGYEAGHMQFDADAGAQCLSSLTALDCARLQTISVCEAAFVPNVSTGGGCERTSECAVATDVCEGNGCGRTCTPAGGAAQSCTRDYECDGGLFCGQDVKCHVPQGAGSFCDRNDAEHPQCGTGLYCDTNAKRCVSLPGAGSPCANAQPRCQPGMFCDFSTGPGLCQPYAAVGATCTDFEACGPGNSCFFNSNPARCAPKSGLDGGCINYADCQSPLVCDRQVCRAGANEGESCINNTACAASLLCDPVRWTCVKGSTHLPTGAACSWWVEACENRDELCKGSSRNPDGGVGTLGTCALKQVGDSCQGNEFCPRGAYCQPNGSTATCVGADAGTPCDSDERCPADLYCPFSLSGRNCAPRLDAGAPCAYGQECSAGDVCRGVPDGGNQCLPQAGPGEYCQNPYDCAGFQACRGSACVPAGHDGQPCVQEYLCVEGHCQNQSDGGSTCYAPLAEGGICGGDDECASLSCSLSGACSAVCP